jgi:hypothetical protein
MSKALVHCLLAGCLGAAAAALGHLGSSCAALLPAGASWPARAACRGACVGSMLAANAVMITLYVRSLRALPSLQATVVSNAANIVATGVLGHTLFGERLTWRWLAGVAIVISGLALITWSAATAAVVAAATPVPAPRQYAEAAAPQRPASTAASAAVAGGATAAADEWSTAQQGEAEGRRPGLRARAARSAARRRA